MEVVISKSTKNTMPGLMALQLSALVRRGQATSPNIQINIEHTNT